MKMKRLMSTLLIVLLSGVTLVACSKQPAEDTVSIYPSSSTLNLEAPVYGEQNPSAQAAASGANNFAFRLSSQLLGEVGNDNFICSPYSVWLPLAALANATDDANRDTLLDALGAAGITADDLNHAASRMLYDLTEERAREYEPDSHNPLRIANALFVSQDEELNGAFAKNFMDYYRGQAFSVDFTDQSAVQAVNQWASQHTDGLIDEIIQQFDPDTVAAIANAIYFSDRWDWEFRAEQTAEGVFYGTSGEDTAHFMLREGDNQTYYEDERLQAMPLRFKSGGVLYILLPKDGDATGLLASMNEAYFTEIQNDSIHATGKLLLPRFKIDGDIISLRDSLEALGIPLFDERLAALTGGVIEGDSPMWLTSAVHKAMIEVDEKGTTAAAVTVMAEAGAAMPEPTEPFEMICDRPFAFILCGQTYDGGSQILFTGVVNTLE